MATRGLMSACVRTMQPSPTSKIQVIDIESLDPKKVHLIFIDPTVIDIEQLCKGEPMFDAEIDAIIIPIYRGADREFIKCISRDSIKAIRQWLDEVEKDKEANAQTAS